LIQKESPDEGWT